MTEPQLRSEIRRLIEALSGGGDAFTDADDLLDRGIVRSINVLEVINYLEDTYGCAINQRAVFEGHFRSIDRMVAFVMRGAA